MAATIGIVLANTAGTEKSLEILKAQEKARENLAVLMKHYQLNQSQLARSLGVQRSTVGKWIKGIRLPEPHLAIEIAEEVKIISVGPSS